LLGLNACYSFSSDDRQVSCTAFIQHFDILLTSKLDADFLGVAGPDVVE
jgi:hypothetical protein